MHGLSPTDPQRSIDWSCASADYSRYRPGYPDSFWRRLRAFDLTLPGLRILDLGTGTGVLARPLAQSGCSVVAIDPAPGQIEAARDLARAEGLAIDFRVATAENTLLPAHSFDLITASQCWIYFDQARAIAETKRLLAPGGRLLTCHLCWLPRCDEIARRTEELVLSFNPHWTAADWHGTVPPIPEWARADFDLSAMFVYDEPIPFTRESWRGRIRACRGVGASLPAQAVADFDTALALLLEEIAPPQFTVLHRIDAHLLSPRPAAIQPARELDRG